MSTLSSNTLSSCSRCSRIYRNTKYKIQISHRTIESYKRINEKAYSLARDAVECSSFVLDVTIEISPKLNEEESCLWSFIVKFLETALLFGKFVVYLFNIDRFKQRVRVGCGTSYMDEQVFVVLKKREIHACEWDRLSRFDCIVVNYLKNWTANILPILIKATTFSENVI